MLSRTRLSFREVLNWLVSEDSKIVTSKKDHLVASVNITQHILYVNIGNISTMNSSTIRISLHWEDLVSEFEGNIIAPKRMVFSNFFSISALSFLIFINRNCNIALSFVH